MTIRKDDYLLSPCSTASIPYWKARSITIPDNMRIVHHDAFDESKYRNYIDEPYFRLMHDLQNLSAQTLPPGYSLCTATLNEFAGHINSCYSSIGITRSALQDYTARAVYDPTLWLAVKDNKTNVIVATGIAELDMEIGEGVLEWIQVSEQYRGHGLGRYIVLELLWRMRDNARFATVSGQCKNPAKPEALYRRCGFTGNDIWHILRKI